jgi:hypothetical protein
MLQDPKITTNTCMQLSGLQIRSTEHKNNKREKKK